MKYLETYNIFEGKSEEKTLKKISKFFKDDFFSKKAISLNPKLAIWIINVFKEKIKDDFETEDEYKKYLRVGSTKGLKMKIPLSQIWNDMSSKIQSIIDWSQSYDISNEDKKNLPKMSFEDAYEKSEEWHNSLKAGGVIDDEHGTILMTFPDGFYWIDLERTYDRDEADAMGHCGNTNRGDTLYSLRDRNKSPHITSAIDTQNGIVYQMKGRNNKKPIDKYHKYIVALLINDELVPPLKGFGAEYDKSNDFNPAEDLEKDLLDKLKEKRPDIDSPVHTPEDIDRMFEDMLNYYVDDSEYGFRLVDWVYGACGFNDVISSLNDTNIKLYEILLKKFPKKFHTEDEDKSKMLDFVSSYIDADTIAKKYNLEIKKNSPINKWDELIRYIGYEELKEIIKDYGYWDKLMKEKLLGLEDFISYPYSYDINRPRYNYEGLLKQVFDDDKKAFEELKKLFDYDYDNNKNYYKDVFDVWDPYELSYKLENKLTTEQKERELDDYNYYEYTGDY